MGVSIERVFFQSPLIGFISLVIILFLAAVIPRFPETLGMFLVHSGKVKHVWNIVRLKSLKCQENLLGYRKIFVACLEDTHLGHLLE